MKRQGMICALAVLLSFLPLRSAFAQDAPLIHSIGFAALGPNDKTPQLLGDRMEYWADDANAQFYLLLDPLPEADGKKPAARLRITLREQARGKTVAVATQPDATSHKAHFLIRAASLAPEKYEVVAELLGADGKAFGNPQSFKFVRADKRSPVIPVPAEGIAILPEAQDILPNAVWPMRVGVPLPVNAVQDARQLALFEDGKPAPANVTPLAAWCAQGSVKWVHLDFLAQYRDGKPASYALKLLPPAPAAATSLKVEQTADRIVVDTGAVRFEVGRKRFAGIEQAWFDPAGEGQYDIGQPVIKGPGGPYLVDGRLIPFDAVSDQKPLVEIEEQGPTQVTIAATGWYTSHENRVGPLGMFKTRITAYAGQPMLRVSQHTIITYDTRQYRLADLGFRIAAAGERFALGADGKTVSGELPKTNALFLHQDRCDHFRLVGIAKDPVEGKVSDGWFRVASPTAGLSLAVRDIWQKFPKEVELGREGISVHFWPKHGDRPFSFESEIERKNIYKYWCFHQGRLLDLQMPGYYFERLLTYPDANFECMPEFGYNGNGEGLAIGNEFALLFSRPEPASSGATPAWARMFQRDPAASASPAWNAGSGAMGDIAGAERGNFASVEDCFEKGMLSWDRSVERGQEYGMWIYPDTHTYWEVANNAAGLHRVWHSSHYHEVGNTWPAYFRTGSPDLLRWARANTDHFINVDTVNYASKTYNERSKRVEPTFKLHVPGAMYHCKAPTPWGSRDYGMDRNDTDMGLWGHWVDTDASLWFWYIGGNPRAKDVYDLWTDSIRKRGAYLTGVRREACTSLAYGVTYYQATWDPDILPSIYGLGLSLRTKEPLELQMPGPLWHILWMNRYYGQTRDPQYIPFILKHARNTWYGDGWALSLYALAYELSGDKTYLAPQLPVLARFPGRFFHSTGDLYDWYGLGPGPQGFYWGDMGWGLFLKQMQRAGISELPADAPAVQPGYPMTTAHEGVDYIAGQPPSLLVLALKEQDREFTILNKLTGLGGDLWLTTMCAFAPSGKQIALIPRIKAPPNSEATVVPKDGETGLYRIEYRAGAFFCSRATDLPHEAQLLVMGKGYRTLDTTAYLRPIGKAGLIELTVSSASDWQPCNFRIQDADGKLMGEASLFVPRPQNTAKMALDPAQHRLPWRIDATGVFTMTFTGGADNILLAFSPESLDVILNRLPVKE